MFILRYMNEEDDLEVKEFVNLSEVKGYISENSLERTWHQVEEIKKVIPNLKED